jgi:uncharacterized protein (TIGR04255 family)
MDAGRHYAKAPITEAIIDLRVQPRDGLSLDNLEHVAASLRQAYPKHDKTYEVAGMMAVLPGVSASATAQQRQTGFKLTSVDGKQIWQSRFDGFTFSRLAPYDSWRPFRDEAHRLWQAYRQVASPLAISRLAVRYINRIDIPAQSVDLKQYFRTSPEVAPDLPQQLAGFFMQLRIPQDDLKSLLLVNQTIIPPAQEGVVSVVLDIDLFRDIEIPSEEDAIWRFFDELHDRKNQIFEACITDETRRLFE